MKPRDRILFLSKSNLIDPQASAFYDSVMADGGVNTVVPTGLIGLSATFRAAKLAARATDITDVFSVFYDSHYLAYKKGTGTGITLGQACEKLYSACGRSGDAVQTTLASQPLLLAHSGVNYAWFPKVVSNYINTSTTYATNNIDFEISISTPNSSTGTQQIIGGNDTTPISVQLNRAANTIFIEYLVGGYKSCSAPFTWASTNIIRVTRNSTTGAFTIINNGTTLTVSGSQTAGVFDSAFNSLCVGGYTSGYSFEGRINYVKCFIGGVLTRYFNPQEFNAATSQTQWTSTTGEVWTINTGTSTTGYKGVLVDRTIVQGDGVDDTMTFATNILNTPSATLYGALRVFDNSVNRTILSLGNNPNEIDIRANDSRIVSVGMFSTDIRMSLYALQKNQSTLQGIGNKNNGSTLTVSTASLATNLNKVYLFSNPYAASGNGVVNTVIVSKNMDNSTVRTAMYNFVKTLNNNAF